VPQRKEGLKAQHKAVPRNNKVKPESKTDKTYIKAIDWLGQPGWGFNASAIDVKNGRVVRIRPLHYDWKYRPEEFKPWKMEARGKVFKPLMKTLLPPLSLAYKKRTYSPNRIKYPLKRVDWDPAGERNPQNRGKSKFRRISWDEAASLIAAEIKRVRKKYGPYAILAQADGHGESKTVHAAHGCQTRLLEIMGGYTLQVRNPDSWEGWYWGAKHMWGMEPLGLMKPYGNMLMDVSQNTDMILYWGCDPETTPWYRSGQAASRFSYWWRELGIKCVYICPDLNYGAAVHADKWIPVLPNTDAALHLAISYIWISEGTYDKDYVATHTVGFDKYRDYVMGKEDGIPKTPEWASQKCGVPEWIIKALAREWAAKKTSVSHFCGGGYIRGPYSHEPARLEVANLAMQGLGKPGIHQFTVVPPVLEPLGGMSTVIPNTVKGCPLGEKMPTLMPLKFIPKQHIPKTLIHKAIPHPPVSFWGTGAITAPVEDQFVKYQYPIPEEEGGAQIRMIWTDSPCRTTCWNGGNETIEAMRNPKIECIVAQHPWMENDLLFADVILPVNTKLEENDIGADQGSLQYCLLFPEHKCIEPIGESKSDYEAVCKVAEKLDVYQEYTDNKTVEQWIKQGYENSGVQDLVSWEELNKKGYYISPTRDNWDKGPAGIIDFYKDPEGSPLSTPTGKIEFYSERLASKFPDDRERPPVPHWIEKSEMHDERISCERAKKYPLLIMSNHGRWRIHAQCDDISWTREIPTCKVKGWDGYMYEPLWINPVDAVKRDIKNGDIVKAYNERGAVLGGAIVWERIMPGVVYQDHGARVDFIIPGELDRGGAINLIAPDGLISKNCGGQATSGYLVEVEKVAMSQMEQWKKQYPDAFAREYDPASGLRFNAWIEA
jgi:anaerobic selenocysteine-containing dehydrogenase